MFGTHVTEADSVDLEDLYVGTLLPFSGEGWPGGEAQNHSIAIAVDSINNRSDMLSGYRLKLVIVDDEVSDFVNCTLLYYFSKLASVDGGSNIIQRKRK